MNNVLMHLSILSPTTLLLEISVVPAGGFDLKNHPRGLLTVQKFGYAKEERDHHYFNEIQTYSS